MMAGLYSVWKREYEAGTTEVYTFSVITMNASPALQHIHDRMPVILDNEQAKIWLQCKQFSVDDAMKMIRSVTVHNNDNKDDKKCLFFKCFLMNSFF